MAFPLIFPTCCYLAGPRELLSANKHWQGTDLRVPWMLRVLAKPAAGNSPTAGKALASLPPSLHSLNEAGSLVLYWDNEGKMGHK